MYLNIFILFNFQKKRSTNLKTAFLYSYFDHVNSTGSTKTITVKHHFLKNLAVLKII